MAHSRDGRYALAAVRGLPRTAILASRWTISAAANPADPTAQVAAPTENPARSRTVSTTRITITMIVAGIRQAAREPRYGG
jgi:hypothetical protein